MICLIPVVAVIAIPAEVETSELFYLNDTLTVFISQLTKNEDNNKAVLASSNA